MLAPDCQCCPLDTHRSAGPWVPVLPPGHLEECWPLSASAAPGPPQECWALSASAAPGHSQESWPLTASAASWSPKGVLTPQCRCCPLDPNSSADPWLPVLSPGPPQACWPWTASAAPWTHSSTGPWVPVLPPGIQCCSLDPGQNFRRLKVANFHLERERHFVCCGKVEDVAPRPVCYVQIVDRL